MPRGVAFYSSLEGFKYQCEMYIECFDFHIVHGAYYILKVATATRVCSTICSPEFIITETHGIKDSLYLIL